MIFRSIAAACVIIGEVLLAGDLVALFFRHPAFGEMLMAYSITLFLVAAITNAASHT